MSLDTMHDVLRRRQRQDFTARELPLLQFQENLTLHTDSPGKRFIYCISGQGGVGKTWLLGKFEEALKNIKSVSAWTNEAEIDVVSVLVAFARQFENQGASLRIFQKRHEDYSRKRREVEKLPDAPKGFSAFLGKGLAKAGVLLARQFPGGGLAVDLLDEKEIANQAGEAAAFLESKIRDKQDQSLLLDPVEALTTAFLADIRRISRKSIVALFFDTFEKTGSFLEPWLFDVLERKYGGVPANLLIIFGGREPLSFDRWAAFESLISRIALEPFTYSEIESYLQKKGITEQGIVEQIEKTTNGLPLLVATIAAQGSNAAAHVTDQSELAVERIFKWIEDAGKRRLALHASAPRFFDREVISIVSRDGDLGGMFAWLISMPFVIQRATHWTLHEVARHQARRFCLRFSAVEWRELHGRLAMHYEELAPNPLQATNREWFESKWQAFLLENIYHKLNQAPDLYLSFALRCCVRAWDVGADLVKRLGDVLLEVSQDTDNPTFETWGLRLQAASVAIEQERALDCVKVLNDLLASGVEFAIAERAVVLHWRSRYHFLAGKIDDAESDINAAIGLHSEDVLLWIERSLVRTSKEMPTADADIYRALELRPDNGFLKNFLAFKKTSSDVVEVFGNDPYFPSKADDTNATQSERELLRPRRAHRFFDEFSKGALLSIARIVQAAGDKARAYEVLRGMDELFPNDAHVLAERGRLYWMLGSRQQAVDDLTKSLSVNPDLPVALCSRYLLFREMGLELQAQEDEQRFSRIAAGNPVAYRYRARVLHGLEKNEDALADLELLVEFQPGVAKWRIDKAELLQELRSYEQALSEYEQAAELEGLGLRDLFGKASCLFALTRYGESLSVFDLLLSNTPKFAKALERRARVLLEMQRYDEAVQDLLKARELQPELVSLNEMGLAYSYAGQFAAAVKCYQQELVDEPNSPATMYNLAVAMARWRGVSGAAGFIERAQRALEEYERKQMFGNADYGFGGLDAVKGNHVAALQRLESAIALEEDAVRWARHDIAWSELRGNAGFEALLVRMAYKL